MFSAKFVKTLFRSPTGDVLFTSLTIQYYGFIGFIHWGDAELPWPSLVPQSNGSCLITKNYIWVWFINLYGIGASVRNDLLEIFFFVFFFSIKYLLAFNQISFVIFAISNFYPIYFKLLSHPSHSLMISLFCEINVFHTARQNIFLSPTQLVAMRVISWFEIGQSPMPMNK